VQDKLAKMLADITGMRLVCLRSERGPLYRYIDFCRNPNTLWNKPKRGVGIG
jgi:hypothetical protein